MAFVDHDVAQRPQEGRPSLVTGKQRVMHQVGVGHDVLAVVAYPSAFIRRGVAVVGCGSKAGDGQSRQARHLVGGESLGGAQIERGGAPTGRGGGTIDKGGEHWQEVAEALPGGGAGRDDDMGAVVGQVRCLALMGPQCRDAGRAES